MNWKELPIKRAVRLILYQLGLWGPSGPLSQRADSGALELKNGTTRSLYIDGRLNFDIFTYELSKPVDSYKYVTGLQLLLLQIIDNTKNKEL